MLETEKSFYNCTLQLIFSVLDHNTSIFSSQISKYMLYEIKIEFFLKWIKLIKNRFQVSLIYTHTTWKYIFQNWSMLVVWFDKTRKLTTWFTPCLDLITTFNRFYSNWNFCSTFFDQWLFSPYPNDWLNWRRFSKN